MSKYLALCDLDDTLLTGEKTITDETVEYLKSWTEKGNYFCICTGRPKNGCIHFYNRLGLDMPLVTDNGCVIHNLEGKDYYFPIEKNLWKEFITEAKGMDRMSYMTTAENIGYGHNLDKVPSWIIHDEDPNFQILEGPMEDTDLSPLICNYWVKDECFDAFQMLMEKYQDKMFMYYWGHREDYHSVEIHSIEASKGLALRFLKNKLGIDEDKTLAFGDAMNDASMLKEAYYGVGMVNSVEEVLQMTKYHSKDDYNHNGVVHFIRDHHLE